MIGDSLAQPSPHRTVPTTASGDTEPAPPDLERVAPLTMAEARARALHILAEAEAERADLLEAEVQRLRDALARIGDLCQIADPHGTNTETGHRDRRPDACWCGVHHATAP